MAGVEIAGFSRTLRHLRTNTPPAKSTTVKLIGTSDGAGNTYGLPCAGWGTIRVDLFTDQQVTLNLLQKPANGKVVPGGPGSPPSGAGSSTTPTFQMRQTDTRTVAATPTTMSNDFTVRGDYYELDVVTGATAPGTFECEVTLLP